MRTEAGVGQEREEAGKGLVSNGRVLLACSLAVAMSAVVMGSNVDVSRANPVQLVSYDPADDFVVLSLKNSSTTPARFPQETLSSGYDVVSNLVEAERAGPLTLRAAARGEFNKGFTAGGACREVAFAETCPAVMALLGNHRRNLASLPMGTLPALKSLEASVVHPDEKAQGRPKVIVASINRNAVAAPAHSIETRPVSKEVADAIVAQAGCETGGMFDECRGFLVLLQDRYEAWPYAAHAALPATEATVMTASLSGTIVAHASENVGPVPEDIVAPVVDPSLKSDEVIVGIASTYNPFNVNDRFAGGLQTASGELYSPIAWTAAIQLKLRGKFAGVRYGRLYKPRFALVERNGKRAIVKINDVGPLRRGRVIDFSAQVMHYFDPSLRLGILDGVQVTPLVGSDWTPGPLGTVPMVAVASNAP